MRRLFIMRKDLQMSPGKLAAQVAHCAEAYWTHQIRSDVVKVSGTETVYVGTVSMTEDVFNEYVSGAFVKTICEAKSKAHLLKARDAAIEIGLVENVDFGCIYDKCLTELEPEEENGTTLTGIWFKPLPDDIAHSISKKYHLYM